MYAEWWHSAAMEVVHIDIRDIDDIDPVKAPSIPRIEKVAGATRQPANAAKTKAEAKPYAKSSTAEAKE